MNKQYYQSGNPFKLKFRKHFCYNCGTKLLTVAHRKVVDQKSEEAEYYDFSAGVDGGVMVGPCEFIHKVFYCYKCTKQIEYRTQLSFEDVEIYIKKLKKKYLKKGIYLEIVKAYELNSREFVDQVAPLEDIRCVYIGGYQDDKMLFMCEIPMVRSNCWERPYYFKISAKKFIKK